MLLNQMVKTVVQEELGLMNPQVDPAGLVFPSKKDDPGYVVRVVVYDSSNNTSTPLFLELKIGDTRKPTLTMIGKVLFMIF